MKFNFVRSSSVRLKSTLTLAVNAYAKLPNQTRCERIAS